MRSKLEMIVSIHQPAYMPWLGYFDRIAKSDLFIMLDNVQFERNSFINRNKIKTSNGTIWLTIPVRLKSHFETTIAEINTDETQDWRRKHLRAIAQSYSRAPGFPAKFQRLSEVFGEKTDNLARICFSQLSFWLGELGIATPVRRASEMAADGRKSELVLNLCKEVGATTYLSGPLGRGYLEESKFAAAGIRVVYQEFAQPNYPQMYGAFVPGLAVVDYWMNCGSPEGLKVRA